MKRIFIRATLAFASCCLMAGTLQADPLKEYVAQKEWIYPVRPAVRLMRDHINLTLSAASKRTGKGVDACCA